MHYYQFNIGDYVSSTQHLDETEDLIYRRILDVYYSKEAPLPKDVDKVARLIRMRTHTESIKTVLQEFFILEKDGYHCLRGDKEISAFKSKSDKARKSAEARWNKNKDLDKSKSNANALKTQSEGSAKHKTLNTKQETLNIYPDSLNQSAWQEWLKYKSAIKSKYKTERGEMTKVNELLKISNGNKELQQKIISQSIDNEWKGLFELKSGNGFNQSSQQQVKAPRMFGE